MTTLKKVTGENIFCGPAVLATLTGKSTDECASVLADIKGLENGYRVTGVKPYEMIEALKKLRFDTTEMPVSNSSLFGTIMYLTQVGEAKYYVGLPEYCIVIEVDEARRAFFNDNHTKEPIKAEQSARLMQKVTRVYKVVAKPELKLVSESVHVSLTQYVKTTKLTFEKRKVYNDEDANECIKLGTVWIDKEDLDSIVEQLNVIAKRG